ncbi:ABC-2 type transport system permease protein [Pseudonocardia sediminis]|uniref:ABC-2 type transport system permease protein n=1 Tax=Pseudonocardia sediminis TaxID=1397368 RepID=A0A4Q7V121_PSEST|nr:ABC transporter permease subunit [Pseudonocardia sediminis]RZT86239.1 ABC-2 type transport system permease protein [Pseudonocardia sediminis]
MTAATLSTTTGDPRPVPTLRLFAAELRWVLRRPRTLIMFGLFALVPILIAIGVVVADGDGDGNGGRGLIGSIGGNGLVLPIAAMTVSLALLLPLAVAVASADAIAGEASHGTLRGLLLSPVGRLRLVGMKAFGVLVVAAVATLVIAVVGVLAGLVVVGGADGQLVTLSGTTVGFGEALGRVGLVALWTIGQLAAVGAVALAVSSFTEHPLVVLASVLGGLITFGVLSAIPALDWLQPYLLTTGWSSAADALRDPLPLDGMGSSSLVALVYLLVGAAVLITRMSRRDA